MRAVTEINDNIQKYNNYREQMGRLKKAIDHGFYLEAIFIEYAIMEDRLESALRHGDKFNPKKHTSMEKKLGKLSEMRRQTKSLESKYFSEELLSSVYDWKSDRNRLIHALCNKLQEHGRSRCDVQCIRLP